MATYANIRPPKIRARQVLSLAERRPLAIRELSEADLEMQRDFFDGLSAQDRYWRFMGPKRELSAPLLRYLSAIDGRNHVAFMAEAMRNGQPVMVAEARYVAEEKNPETCEFALAVADDWQGRGLATRLLQMLESHAGKSGRRKLIAETLHGNAAMIDLARKAGYTVALNCRDPRVMRLSKTIASPHQAAA